MKIRYQLALLFSFYLSPLNASPDLVIFQLEDPSQLVKLSGSWKFNPKDDLNQAQRQYSDQKWRQLSIPAQWNNSGLSGFKIGWYRHSFRVSKTFKNQNISILTPIIADANEIYINGVLVGRTGLLTDKGEILKKSSRINVYQIPPNLIDFETENTIAVRVGDDVGWGGFVNSEFYIGESNLIQGKILSIHYVEFCNLFCFFIFCIVLFYSLVTK